LEKQTELIVGSIQALLTELKSPIFSSDEFDNTIESICSVVSALVEASEGPLLSAGVDCKDILGKLISSRELLYELASGLMRDPSSKSVKQQIASAAYEIAKFVKALIGSI
jgi:hypothetical protein